MNDDSNYLLSSEQDLENKRMGRAIALPQKELEIFTFDLSTARSENNPFSIGFPFKSIFIRDATDTSVAIKLNMGTEATYQASAEFRKNDSAVQSIRQKGFLWWDAQSGKSITVYVFATMEYRSGSQISQNGGGVSLNDGSAFSTARVDIATSAFAVCASNSSRKVATIQNNSGADVWFGGSSVTTTGANLGIRLAAGASMQWRNTAALYGIALAASTGDNGLLVVEES